MTNRCAFTHWVKITGTAKGEIICIILNAFAPFAFFAANRTNKGVVQLRFLGFMQGQRYPPGSCACICACRRDHESWPGGESRRRDLNRSLAAGLQALPGPPSSLRSSPTGFFRRPPSHECRLRRLTNAPLRGCTNSDSRAVGFVKRFVDIRVPRRRRS